MLDLRLSSWLYVSSVIDVAQDKSLPCMACCFLNSKARDFSHHELFPSTRPPCLTVMEVAFGFPSFSQERIGISTVSEQTVL